MPSLGVMDRSEFGGWGQEALCQLEDKNQEGKVSNPISHHVGNACLQNKTNQEKGGEKQGLDLLAFHSGSSL